MWVKSARASQGTAVATPLPREARRGRRYHAAGALSPQPTARPDMISRRPTARPVLKASSDAEIDVAFDAFIQQRVQALLIGPGPLFVTRMDRLVAFAARHSLPAMYSRRRAG